MLKKKSLCALFTLIMLLGLTLPTISSAAPNYPRRPITVIIPYVPGGWVELACRPFLEAMGKELGVNMVISMMPGAGGSIGVTKASQAKADGYTLYIAAETTFSYHPLTKNVRYTKEDANVIYGVVNAPEMLATSKKNSNFNDFDSFIKYAKENPGKVTFGLTGMTSVHFAAMKQMEEKYGIKLQAVPFDGAIQITNAIVSGHIDCGLTQYTQNSELQAILMANGKTDYFPDVPTFADLGSPEISTRSEMALLAPKALPQEIYDMLLSAAQKASQDTAFIELCEKLRYEPSISSADEVQQRLDAQTEIIKKLIADGAIVPDKK